MNTAMQETLNMSYGDDERIITTGTPRDPHQIKIRADFKQKFLNKMNERKINPSRSKNLLKEKNIERADFFVEYKLKYGSIKRIEALAKKLEIPMSISQIYMNFDFKNSNLSFPIHFTVQPFNKAL